MPYIKQRLLVLVVDNAVVVVLDVTVVEAVRVVVMVDALAALVVETVIMVAIHHVAEVAIQVAQPIADTLVVEVVEHRVLEQPETEVLAHLGGVSYYAHLHVTLIQIPVAIHTMAIISGEPKEPKLCIVQLTQALQLTHMELLQSLKLV